MKRERPIGADGRTMLRIGELCAEAGVTPATVHHYVREGLLPEPQKPRRNTALYEASCVERVRLVKALQQESRRSLAEVRDLVARVDDSGGLAQLREIVEAEAGWARSSPLAPHAALTAEELARQTGFSDLELRALEAAELVAARGRGPARLFPPADVAVAHALAGLRAAGFDLAHGFTPADVRMYLVAMRDLIDEEVALFLARARPEEDAAALVERARRGIEGHAALDGAATQAHRRAALGRRPCPHRRVGGGEARAAQEARAPGRGT
ncbi:MAG: MerR family transcriptional regulator [Sandaracinaceae bacterium]|nr:MerR family transcriptional regulator [Sandaracinaceae bacterium]